MEAVKQKLDDTVKKGRQNGASGVKIWYSSGITRGCNFKNGTLKEIESNNTTSMSVTVIKNGRQGTSTVNSTDDLDLGLEKAFDIARFGKKVYFEEYPKHEKYASVKTYSADAVIELDDLVNENRKFPAAMSELDPDLNVTNSGHTNTSDQIIALSNGLQRSFRTTYWDFSGSGQSSSEGDVYYIDDFTGSRTGEDGVSFDPVIEGCKRTYELGKTVSRITDGKYPVLLDPSCIWGFGMILERGVNGKQVYEGSSPLKDKLGKQVFHKNITVIDNPLIDFDLWASIMDADGIPTKAVPVMENGVLKMFAYDLNTASLCKTEPTGHSGCSLNRPILMPGKKSSSDIIKSIKKGIYVLRVLGFGQGNIINGDFSANVATGFLIENGEIKGRIKNTMIAGNMYKIAKRHTEISSDTDRVYRQPYLLLDGVQVSAKS